MSRLCAALAALLALALSLSLPARAAEPQHPLIIIRVEYAAEPGSSAGPVHGKGVIWLRNLADVAVDGIRVEILMKTSTGRVADTIVKKVGVLEAGKRAYVKFEWDEYSSESLKPEFWVYYNGGESKEVKFQAEPPVW